MTTRRERGLNRKTYRTPVEYYIDRNIDLSPAADLYGATMAYAWYKNNMAHRQAVGNWFFRENPFDAGYTVFMGLASIQQFLEKLTIPSGTIDYLATLDGRDGKPLFADESFFDFLSNFKNEIYVDAFPEGSVCFPRQPIVRFRGPIWQFNFWEGFFLNQLNFWTLIGTKAARMVYAANGKPISESGFRRGQGLDGHLTAAIAAYCAGAAGTSNLMAGKLFGLPIYGTFAHSYVSSFGNNFDAFTSYGRVFPANSVFLVDTFDTLEGVLVAITVAKTMERQGHKVFGIRLDSGDLSWLSKEARRLLDDAGLNYVKILASNQLNEYKIGAHERDGSMIDIYAPGTELATGGKDSALGGVLKLVAIEDENGVLQDRIKLSSDTVKITIPGMQEVARYSDTAGKFVGDCIYDPRVSRAGDDRLIVNPADLIQSKRIPDDYRFHDLLKPASYAGVVQGGIPSFDEVRARVKSQVASLDKSVRRIEEPHPYPAGISPELDSRIRGMIIAERSR